MIRFDKFFERSARVVAQRTSRRHFLSRLGGVLLGAAAIPVLPVARAAENVEDPKGSVGDPTSCDYWRHCAIDGFLCSCCGGSSSTCPPGTEISPITWIGTCRNPADGRDYVISYNDCCGTSSCGRCGCQRDEGDRPVYQPSFSNAINWCLGIESAIYNCSTAVVIGIADG